MAKRNDVDVLLQRKASLEETLDSHYPDLRLSVLADEAIKAANAGESLDIYPVRAVSRAEILCRKLIGEMIRSSRPHAQRAIELVANVKPDYELLLSVSNDQLTFADIVAHTAALSNLSSVVAVFEKLCGVKLVEQLPLVTNEYGFTHEPDARPLIDDYQSTIADVSSVFDLRHRICHESLSPVAKELIEIQTKMRSFINFFSALNGFVTKQIHPNLPRTQAEMNAAAGNSLAKAREEMDRCIKAIKEQDKAWPDKIRRLETSQEAWEKFVEVQQIMRHDPSGGGSIGPLLRAREAEQLTRERVTHLKWYAERREGCM